jgi:hypothetical protein
VNLLKKIDELERAYENQTPIKEEIREIQFTENLPNVVKENILKYKQLLNQNKNITYPRYSIYKIFIDSINLNIIAPIFEDEYLAENFWKKLVETSEESTQFFINGLLNLTSDLNFNLYEQEKRAKDDNIKSNKILSVMEKTLALCKQYDEGHNYYIRGANISMENLIAIMDKHSMCVRSDDTVDYNTKQFTDQLLKVTKNFQYNEGELRIITHEMMQEIISRHYKEASQILKLKKESSRNTKINKNSYLSREINRDKAAEQFIIRKIVYSLRNNFNQPMYAKVADIMQIMFNSDYNEDNIKTITRGIK